jgi:hypothetical protein
MGSQPAGVRVTRDPKWIHSSANAAGRRNS